ncbi:MAG: hypothetical protein GY757_10420, partial [bacterium]|nr:hypothetical protein [bacterium]
PKVLVNFIKKDENIYYAQSLSHPHFWTGIGISLLFNIVLFFLGMNLFERSLYPSLKKPEVLKAIDIDFYDENCTAISSYSSSLFEQILKVFFGRSGHFSGEMLMNEKTIVNSTKEEFLYLHNPDKLPVEVKAKDFITLVSMLLKLSGAERQTLEAGLDSELLSRKFCDIKSGDKATLLFNLAEVRDFKTVILHNIDKGTDNKYEADALARFSRLKKRPGGLILFVEKTLPFFLSDLNYLYHENGDSYDQERSMPNPNARIPEN